MAAPVSSPEEVAYQATKKHYQRDLQLLQDTLTAVLSFKSELDIRVSNLQHERVQKPQAQELRKESANSLKKLKEFFGLLKKAQELVPKYQQRQQLLKPDESNVEEFYSIEKQRRFQEVSDCLTNITVLAQKIDAHLNGAFFKRSSCAYHIGKLDQIVQRQGQPLDIFSRLTHFLNPVKIDESGQPKPQVEIPEFIHKVYTWALSLRGHVDPSCTDRSGEVLAFSDDEEFQGDALPASSPPSSTEADEEDAVQSDGEEKEEPTSDTEPPASQSEATAKYQRLKLQTRAHADADA